MHPNDRSRLTFMIRYAARHPQRIVPHGRRLARDAVLRLKNRDHVSYYRAVMKSDAARSDEGAVGSHTHESWLKIGQMQFDYLVSHGLKPGMRMLEIGCGNLRPAACSLTTWTRATTTGSTSPPTSCWPHSARWPRSACRTSCRT